MKQLTRILMLFLGVMAIVAALVFCNCHSRTAPADSMDHSVMIDSMDGAAMTAAIVTGLEDFIEEVEVQEVSAAAPSDEVVCRSVERSYILLNATEIQSSPGTLIRKWAGVGPVHQWIKA
ncbi:MAG: hypothetical protein PHI12_09715 [Dehalococcoidales bacterium]|nr:hypothetical protein [Dehalococcoidales bacterium]